jgi:hypothetical protein
MAYDTYQQAASFLAKFGLFHPLREKTRLVSVSQSKKIKAGMNQFGKT